VIKDSRKWKHPTRLETGDDHDYMDRHINTPEWNQKQRDKIERNEVAQELGIYKGQTRDIMGFIRDNAPLKPWQSDIISMLYQESMYFAPQRITKMLNEGWASYVDFNIMCRKGLVGLGQKTYDSGIFEYAQHKMGVLGGKYSTNPYKLGFCMFMEIEERWNKGRFGTAYDDCTDLVQRENWDENLNLGNQKVFEVRKHYNDLTAIAEFFTPDFCDKYEFFNWKRFGNGDVKIEDRDFNNIKQGLMKKYMNGGLPEIYLVDPNYKGKGYMLLEHKHEGQPLYTPYVEAVLQSLYFLWGNDIYLVSKDEDGEEVVFGCYGSEDGMTDVMTRGDHEKPKLRAEKASAE
jgi:stage V sporulation protein R